MNNEIPEPSLKVKPLSPDGESKTAGGLGETVAKRSFSSWAVSEACLARDTQNDERSKRNRCVRRNSR